MSPHSNRNKPQLRQPLTISEEILNQRPPWSLCPFQCFLNTVTKVKRGSIRSPQCLEPPSDSSLHSEESSKSLMDSSSHTTAHTVWSLGCCSALSVSSVWHLSGGVYRWALPAWQLCPCHLFPKVGLFTSLTLFFPLFKVMQPMCQQICRHLYIFPIKVTVRQNLCLCGLFLWPC